jgi:ribosomal protein L7/L12
VILSVGRWTLTIKLENNIQKLHKRLQELMAGGYRINAIKEYRAATGATLKAACEFVDKLPSIPDFMAVPRD